MGEITLALFIFKKLGDINVALHKTRGYSTVTLFARLRG
jgi:hypothetical protein